jgi:hypothetical protein
VALRKALLGGQECGGGWFLVNFQPIQPKLPDDLLEGSKIDWLLNVTVYTELITIHEITFLA